MSFENPIDRINRQIEQTQSNMNRMFDDVSRANREKLHREISNYEALQEIAENTRVLKSLFEVIHANKEQQDEIIDLLTEIISINKANNLKEAESKYRKVMDKISKFKGDIETMQKLQSFLVAAWRQIVPIFENFKDGL